MTSCLDVIKRRALFVLFDYLGPSQQFFSYVWMGLPGLNKYLASIKMSCSRTLVRLELATPYNVMQ